MQPFPLAVTVLEALGCSRRRSSQYAVTGDRLRPLAGRIDCSHGKVVSTRWYAKQGLELSCCDAELICNRLANQAPRKRLIPARAFSSQHEGEHLEAGSARRCGRKDSPPSVREVGAKSNVAPSRTPLPGRTSLPMPSSGIGRHRITSIFQ